MRTLTNDAASKVWDEAYALKAEIARNEAERRKPVMIHGSDWQAIVTLTIAFLMGCTLGGLFG